MQHVSSYTDHHRRHQVIDLLLSRTVLLPPYFPKFLGLIHYIHSEFNIKKERQAGVDGTVGHARGNISLKHECYLDSIENCSLVTRHSYCYWRRFWLTSKVEIASWGVDLQKGSIQRVFNTTRAALSHFLLQLLNKATILAINRSNFQDNPIVEDNPIVQEIFNYGLD